MRDTRFIENEFTNENGIVSRDSLLKVIFRVFTREALLPPFLDLYMSNIFLRRLHGMSK